MIAAQFTDPENARIIFFAAGGLLVIAIGVVVATIVWWRSSGIEPTALAPLEVMSTRSWWDGDDDTRREQVEAVRGQADLRAGPPEAGQIVERVGTLSGVSLVGSGAATDFVDDDVLDDEYDDHFDDHHDEYDDHEYDDDAAVEPAAPARRGYRRAAKREPEVAALDRLAQFEAEALPVAPAAPRRAERAAPAERVDPVGLADLAVGPQASGAGLFDQFADDAFADVAPPPARPRRAAPPAAAQPSPRQPSPRQPAPRQPSPRQTVAKSPQEIEADLWGGAVEPRRSIDPLLGDR